MFHPHVSASRAVAPSTDVQALPHGSTIDRYVLHEVVAEDDFGIVYRAEDTELDCQVAVKEHLPRRLALRHGPRDVGARSPERAEAFAASVQAFAEEAAALRSLRIPSLVSVSHVWQENGTVYRAMPWLEGETLASRLAADILPTDESFVQTVLEPLLNGLLALHMRGLVHGRLSDRTIFLTAESRVLLLGFRKDLRAAGASRPGDDAYAPLELTQALTHAPGDIAIGPWSDLYGIGALLYRIVGGKLPPPARRRLLNDACRTLAQQKNTGWSPEALSAIDWALNVLPERRPRDILDFRKRLRSAARDTIPGTQHLSSRLSAVPAELRLRDLTTALPTRKAPPAVEAERDAAEDRADFVSTRPMVYGDMTGTVLPFPAPQRPAPPPVAEWTLPAALTEPQSPHAGSQRGAETAAPLAPAPAAASAPSTPIDESTPAAANPQATGAAPRPKPERASRPSPTPLPRLARRPMSRRDRWLCAAAIAAGLAVFTLGAGWLLEPWLRPPLDSAAISLRAPSAPAAPAPASASTPSPAAAPEPVPAPEAEARTEAVEPTIGAKAGTPSREAAPTVARAAAPVAGRAPTATPRQTASAPMTPPADRTARAMPSAGKPSNRSCADLLSRQSLGMAGAFPNPSNTTCP